MVPLLSRLLGRQADVINGLPDMRPCLFDLAILGRRTIGVRGAGPEADSLGHLDALEPRGTPDASFAQYLRDRLLDRCFGRRDDRGRRWRSFAAHARGDQQRAP
jgi:hypothetical protein